MKLILVHGASKDSPRLAAETGWEYGTREDYVAQAPVYMFDWNWKKAFTATRWQRYLRLIASHRPYLAMVPDLECQSQWYGLMRQIVDVKKAGAKKVVVTPKYAGALERLPYWDTFVIGISVPAETYASYLPEPASVVGRRLHLLGGNPDQWLYLKHVYEKAGSTVVSADGNFAMRQARLGKYWSAKKGGYVEMRGEGFDTEALVKATLKNVQWYINDPPELASLIGLPRVQKCIAALYPQLSFLGAAS